MKKERKKLDEELEWVEFKDYMNFISESVICHQFLRVDESTIIAFSFTISLFEYDPDAEVGSAKVCPYCHRNDYFDTEWGLWCPNCDSELQESELIVEVN
jgi:hypothetical protein